MGLRPIDGRPGWFRDEATGDELKFKGGKAVGGTIARSKPIEASKTSRFEELDLDPLPKPVEPELRPIVDPISKPFVREKAISPVAGFVDPNTFERAPTLWRMSDGTEIEISEMSDEHLLNAAAMIWKKILEALPGVRFTGPGWRTAKRKAYNLAPLAFMDLLNEIRSRIHLGRAFYAQVGYELYFVLNVMEEGR